MRHFRLLSSYISFIIFSFFFSSHLVSQDSYLDSLLNVVATEENKHELLSANYRLGHYFRGEDNDQAIKYYSETIALSEELEEELFFANSNYSLGYTYLIKGDYDLAIDHYLQSVRIYEEMEDDFRLANGLISISIVYNEMDDLDKTEEYHDKAQIAVERGGDTLQLVDLLNSRGVLSDKRNNYDQAITYLEEAYALAKGQNYSSMMNYTMSNLALTLKHQGKLQEALGMFEDVLEGFKTSNPHPTNWAAIYNNIGSTHLELNEFDKAEEAFLLSKDYAQEAESLFTEMEAYKLLAEIKSETYNYKDQVSYLEKYYTLKDSIFSLESKNTIVQLEADYQIEQKNSELLQKENELVKQTNQRNMLLFLAVGIALLLSFVSLFYSRIKKANALLADRNEQINKQKDELEESIDNLKRTQTQLIHSEKMASLGELTAGIAHEIQNPLNFVNNFSGVSSELIEEAFEELKKNDIEEVKEVLNDLKSNLNKINHHGGRASSIVKGMLDHSRESSGQKVSTDINALCDEYIRLSYHGMRAKDKDFDAEFDLDLDSNLPKIKVIPQEIGRVLLNVFNNAFYACAERSRSTVQQKDLTSLYHPKVTVSTVPLEGEKGVEIKIIDNGIGMSQETMDKVFQPFFTTKPTGQGTGLGMSISYDIVTKGHDGKMTVESEIGKGSTFVIIL